MFGESESESPRVPSPWDSLISTPPSPSPKSHPSPLAIATKVIPKLVPEAEEGNVEYKLQLLSPSPARFARLVTQMKWRLLEGGGQAYYELGVADSGALIGLPRAELEQSLETLEMMAGEIGASVIVVKEIEVPGVMAGLAGSETDRWNGKRSRRRLGLGSEGEDSTEDSTLTSVTTEFETDLDEEGDDVSLNAKAHSVTFHLRSSPTHDTSALALFPMDTEPELDPADNADAEPDPDLDLDPPSFFSHAKSQSPTSIDLEIASVFKPRPMRTRVSHTHTHMLTDPNAKNKRGSGPKVKKRVHQFAVATPSAALAYTAPNPTHTHVHHVGSEAHAQGKQHAKSLNRRQTRDRRRDEKRRALLAYATSAPGTQSTDHAHPAVETHDPDSHEGAVRDMETTVAASVPALHPDDALVSGLASLHVSLDDPVAIPAAFDTNSIPTLHLTADPDEEEDVDDVFATPTTAGPFTTFPSSDSTSYFTTNIVSSSSTTTGPVADVNGFNGAGAHGQTRLIVEALVVRKMSLEEAFLDFGGFSLI